MILCVITHLLASELANFTVCLCRECLFFHNSFNSSYFLYHLCVVFLVGGEPKHLLAILLTMLFCIPITVNLKYTVYETYVCLVDIPKTSLLSVNSFALCATEQLVQGTPQHCFSASKDVM